MRVKVQFDTRNAERALRALGARAPQAISRSLNRAGGSVRTHMTREVSRDTQLTQADVRKDISIVNATPSRLVVRILASLKRIPLIRFGAKGPEPSYGKGRGVTARTATRRYPHAFIATMLSGHRGVFERKGANRLPVAESHGPSIGRVFYKHVQGGLARGAEQLVKNLRHEVTRLVHEAARR